MRQFDVVVNKDRDPTHVVVLQSDLTLQLNTIVVAPYT